MIAGAREVARRHHSFVFRTDPDVPAGDTQFLDMMTKRGFTLRTAGKNFDGIQPRFVFRLSIEGMTEEEVLAHISQKTRYNIRLASKKGVEVRLVGEEMVEEFTKIMAVTGERDGCSTRPAWYFAKILQEMGEDARLYMAFYQEIPIAGALAIAYGDKLWYLYGASSNEYRNIMPNYLLQWEMIRWAVETGRRVYDFRGVSGDLSEDNPLFGLYRFKKGFNGELCEFIGEFEMVLKPAVNTLWQAAERARKALRR